MNGEIETTNSVIPGLEIRERVETSSSPRARRQNSESTAKTIEKKRYDGYLWGVYALLILVSVIELYSASATEVSVGNVYSPLIRHGIFLAGGFFIMLAFQNMHYKNLRRWAWLVALISLLLVVLTSVIGVNINGAQRAISILGFTIQPAEICKLSVIVWLATILSRNQLPGGVTKKGIIQVAAVVAIFSGLLISNGTTNTLILMIISISMFVLGGLNMTQISKIFLFYLVIFMLFSGIKIMFSSDDELEKVDKERAEMVVGADEMINRRADVEEEGFGSHEEKAVSAISKVGRMGTVINRLKDYFGGISPDSELTDYNRQKMMSRFAQAHGGLFGRGPGNSRESARLPLAFSDYIYSIIVEDSGFVGGAILVILYLIILARAGRIAFLCQHAFPAFLVLGCALLIVLQALIHMAIVTGMYPVSGQPLPFISKGGTSILVMSAAMGIMMSVSKYAVMTEDKKAINAESKALPEDMRAANISQI